jgi:catalase
MIEMFKKCDEEYGRRVEDGIKNAEATSSREPIGAEGAADAPRQAEEEGHSADPY